jgi:aminopeptidase-like protein
LGGNKKLSYKLSKIGNSFIDRMFLNLFQNNLVDLRKFDPTSGSDERQFCSPGFNFGFGQISRLIYKTYKEYHTDGDNKKIMGIDNIIFSKEKICRFISILEFAGKIKRIMPYGEIQLSKYNLYPSKNFNSSTLDFKKSKLTKIILGILSYSDGTKDIIDIANDLGICVFELIEPLKILIQLKLIKIRL